MRTKKTSFKDHIPKDQEEIDETLELIKDVKEEEKEPSDLSQLKKRKGGEEVKD